jgi:hypothetical protein
MSIEQVQFESDDALRERHRKMSDEKLREMGEAARYMCTPGAPSANRRASVSRTSYASRRKYGGNGTLERTNERTEETCHRRETSMRGDRMKETGKSFCLVIVLFAAILFSGIISAQTPTQNTLPKQRTSHVKGRDVLTTLAVLLAASL